MADNLEIQDNEEDCAQIIHFDSIGSPDATDAESPNEFDSKDDSFELSRKAERKSFENLELDFESDINIKEADVENVEQSHCEDKSEENGDKEKKTAEQVNKELEEGEDDEGEISSDDDEELEEGEVKDKDTSEFPNKLGGRQICRFFNRGKCTFGKVCRFLHLNNNSQGNYSMFPNTGNAYFPPVTEQVYMMNPRTRNQDYFIPPPIPSEEPTPLETAWERGLRAAKELVKKAHIRRGASPDFDEKRLNLTPSLDTTETDKENSDKKRERHSQETYYKSEDELPPYNYSEPSWKRNYDNFEVRYNNREDVPSYREKDRSRSYRRESSPIDRERDKYGGAKGIHRNENDPRAVGAVSRKRAEEWFDPYRRSKSPKGRRSRSRTRSYSSVSSYSHSENRSSASRYSRSSSRSSGDSSRSPSPFIPKRRSPNQAISSPKGENRYLPKKRTGGRMARSRSYTRSHSSRSRSMSRSSSSRSISMDSITSPESGSSSGSLVRQKQNIAMPSHKDEDKERNDEKRRRQLYYQLQSLRGNKDENESKNIDTLKTDDGDYIDDTLSDMQEVSGPSFPSLEYLLPTSEKKEPVKAKQPIKLTLLNKPPQSKFSSMPKKFDLKYKETGEPSNFGTSQSSLKRPLSPPSQATPNKPAVALKKSASSRRDELLKQLKAVEDAIARKRSKMV